MSSAKRDHIPDRPENDGGEMSSLPDPEHYRFLKSVRLLPCSSGMSPEFRDFLTEGRRIRLVRDDSSPDDALLIRVECHRGPFDGACIGYIPRTDAGKWASRMDEGICFAGWIGPEDPSPGRIRISVYERILFPMDDLASFEFRQGGFFRPVVTVKLSFREKLLIYRKSAEPENSPVQQVSIRFYPRKWDTFVLPAIRRCNFPAWRKRYVDPCVCDGVSWSMKLRFSSGSCKQISGSNEFPEEWDHFQSFLEQSLDMRDVKGSGTFSILPPAAPDGL